MVGIIQRFILNTKCTTSLFPSYHIPNSLFNQHPRMVNAAHSCSLAGILVFEERMMTWSASRVGNDSKISSCGRAVATKTSTELVRAKSHPNSTNLAGGTGCSLPRGHHTLHHAVAMADAPRLAS
uniref:Uncharacterized protein n=1 Tax=Oryza brachyantha TaxID=4533 RepID=J3M5L6_ORYBR